MGRWAQRVGLMITPKSGRFAARRSGWPRYPPPLLTPPPLTAAATLPPLRRDQLAGLEDTLLRDLAASEGSLLANKTLIDGLNQIKGQSLTIGRSLEESHACAGARSRNSGGTLPPPFPVPR